MKALAAMILLGLLAGCSVNVIVAPHAVLAVDSANKRTDSAVIMPEAEYEVVE